MAKCIAFAVLILGLAPSTASPQDSPANKPLAEVGFTLHQNAVILPAVIDGGDSVRLLLDTGWGPLALVSSSATRLGLTVDAPVGDGFPHARVGSLAIGDAKQSHPVVEVFSDETLAPLIGPHDGILSTAFFRDFVLQIDYPGRVVRFFRRSPITATAADGSSSTSVPMIILPGIGALPFTDSVAVDGRPVRALFDTGGAGAFVAMRQLVERAGLRAEPDSGAARTGIGMLSGGQMVQQRVQFARVGRVSVGSFVANSPRVMLAPPQLEGDDWGHDLIIGYGFMRHYVVTFDYLGRRVTFTGPPETRR